VTIFQISRVFSLDKTEETWANKRTTKDLEWIRRSILNGDDPNASEQELHDVEAELERRKA